MDYDDDDKRIHIPEPSYEELYETIKRLQNEREMLEQQQKEWERIQERKFWPDNPEQFEPPKPPPAPPKTCRHLRENNRFCGSLAVKGRDYCYHHLRERGRRLKMARARARGEHLPLQLPLLEDMYAVQVSIMLVVDSLLNGKLDRRDASLALYGLQQAATNLARPRAVWEQASPFELAAGEGPSEYDGFAKEFGLPEDLDPDTPPEVAFAETAEEEASQEKANLFEVTAVDVELAEIQQRESPGAMWRRVQQLDEAEKRRYLRAQKQLAHARHVVRAEAQNAANRARKEPQSAAAEADAASPGKDQSA